MEINNYSLNPFFARVFPTFKPGDEWIDLKDKTGKPDRIKQPSEILQPLDEVGNENTEINDYEIVSFLKENIQGIPEDKIQELFPLLLDYVKSNPMGGYYYAGEDSFYAKDAMAAIIANNPQYVASVESFLTSNNFLIRWAGIQVLAVSEIEYVVIKTELQEKLGGLYEKEMSKKVANEEQDIKTTYYQVNELYAEYLGELKGLIDYLSK
ncbi:MAG: hypothetical protein LBJ25_01595 [Candidatus Margulisbacteria bacterium]|jgi:hypothetical protein|nr:hypothetical protein [Candidatus Margulisiibacteriota bacterium]